MCLLVRGGKHRHGREDFNALFDFMEADLKGTPLPEKITWIPYDDKEPLHDWKALLK